MLILYRKENNNSTAVDVVESRKVINKMCSLLSFETSLQDLQKIFIFKVFLGSHSGKNNTVISMEGSQTWGQGAGVDVL